MARTNKRGIDYFPFDVDFFHDDKIQLVEAEFGVKGSAIAIRLLCKIYDNGYYYQWGGDECLLFTKNMGAEFVPSAVDEVVKGLVRRCFFDKGCFDRFCILTSKGIQERYFEAIKRYKSVDVFEEYLLSDVAKNINVNIIPINVSINWINADINSQKKRKESKVEEKEKKERKIASRFSPPSLDELKKFIVGKGYSVDAEAFIAFYQSKNWFVGKNKMIDWRAAVVTWEKRELNKPRIFGREGQYLPPANNEEKQRLLAKIGG